ncbi:bifunctional 2-methylcitrate synthase/citrate synthase, partial [Acinetobacter baumannii]|nr:bifunctional 2-methylcitrate synthase/citrate synthase [Acinetobacter baumannii]
FAAFPAVVAYDQRRRRGQDVVEPRENLDYSQNFLWMTFGEEAAPEVVDAFRVSMVLYAEHSFNASTFTSRVIAGTGSDIHSAITGAIGALRGPKHGGANEVALDIQKRYENDDEAEADIRNRVANKEVVIGFGHPVYTI